jgi:hypothetical protein
MDIFKKLLDFDTSSGKFFWKSGKEAGTKSVYGYWVIRIKYRQYRRGRLAFLFTHGRWPKPFVDHIDRNRLNDRPENLRECTRSQNMWNQRRRGPGKRNPKMGVCFIQGRYQAQIQQYGKRIYLGRFETPEQAGEAYQAKRLELFGEFA